MIEWAYFKKSNTNAFFTTEGTEFTEKYNINHEGHEEHEGRENIPARGALLTPGDYRRSPLLRANNTKMRKSG